MADWHLSALSRMQLKIGPVHSKNFLFQKLVQRNEFVQFYEEEKNVDVVFET